MEPRQDDQVDVSIGAPDAGTQGRCPRPNGSMAHTDDRVNPTIGIQGRLQSETADRDAPRMEPQIGIRADDRTIVEIPARWPASAAQPQWSPNDRNWARLGKAEGLAERWST